MKIILSLFLALIILSSCREDTGVVRPVEKKDTIIPCPPPVRDNMGNLRIPPVSHNLQRVSYDGRKISYIENESRVRVLDLQSGVSEIIDIRTQLPQHMKFSAPYHMVWSPYDYRFVIECVTYSDTTGDGHYIVYGQQMVMVNVPMKTVEVITPPEFSKAGFQACAIYSWLKGSVPGNDSLFIGYVERGRKGKTVPAVVFELQKAILTPINFPPILYKNIDYDHSGSIYSIITYIPGNAVNDQLRVNDVTSTAYGPKLMTIGISPDGKKIALCVNPTFTDINDKWEQIWIIDTQRFLQEKPDTLVPHRIINLQKEFCMYSMLGADAVFLTDTTMAVSMHEDGGQISALWEVSVTGRKIRQLTFTP